MQHFCSDSQRSLKLFAHRLEGHLPENLRFNAIISEILKQCNHTRDWLRKERGQPGVIPAKRRAFYFQLAIDNGNVGL
jgi:hypothetical protein